MNEQNRFVLVNGVGYVCLRIAISLRVEYQSDETFVMFWGLSIKFGIFADTGTHIWSESSVKHIRIGVCVCVCMCVCACVRDVCLFRLSFCLRCPS